jgi:hypothetical protein
MTRTGSSSLALGPRPRERRSLPTISTRWEQYFVTTDSMWIGQATAGSGDVDSPYTFRQPFNLAGSDPASVSNGAPV